MKKRIILTFIVIGIIVAGVLAVKNKHKSLDAMKVPESEKISVKLYMPHFKQASLSLQTLAEVGSDNEVVFTPRFGAMVESMAPLGATCKKGDTILQLDSTDIKTDILNLNLDISTAKEDLNAKQSIYETVHNAHSRTIELLAVGGASKEQSQNEQAQLSSAQAAVVSAKSKISTLHAKVLMENNLLRYTRLIAPYDGVVTQKEVNIGDYVPVSKPILTFSGYDGKYLKIKLPQSESAQKISYNGEILPLLPLISSLDSLQTFVARPLHVKENTGAKINVSLISYDNNATYLPADTLLRQSNGDMILIYSNGKVIPKKIILEHCDASGCVTQEHLDGKQLIQASPDVLLRALSGTALHVGH